DGVPVVSAAGEFKVEAEGEIVDYAVKMRRLPEEGMMAPLLERGGVTSSQIRDLGRRIAEFHATTERNDETDKLGGLETVTTNWRENFEQTEAYIGRTVTQQQFDEIRRFVDRTLAQEASLFQQRVQEGRARDCHGDLRADAVCFEPDGVCIFDCIEFSERFRRCDVAADIAFLAMDLEFRGRQDLADELMASYLGVTLDATLPLLMPFYKCYRAYVRGKVDGFQLDQPEIGDAQKREVAEGARRFFELAQTYATQKAPPALIVTIGVTGSGKSYLANSLAARIGAAVFSSDVLRKRLLDIEPTERHIDEIDSGVYSPESTEQTYRELLDQARPWLERGKPVVLDASYLRAEHRQAALRLAEETSARFLALECQANESLIRERLGERQGAEQVVSDGRWEVYQVQMERLQPPDELPASARVTVDSAQPLRTQIDGIVTRLTS
ncbi:MAG: AAA family ATPase, partial [Chloroflexi bacterium]|nr:AAA family ATPase [Chloroflexota bacterium]